MIKEYVIRENDFIQQRYTLTNGVAKYDFLVYMISLCMSSMLPYKVSGFGTKCLEFFFFLSSEVKLVLNL